MKGTVEMNVTTLNSPSICDDDCLSPLTFGNIVEFLRLVSQFRAMFAFSMLFPIGTMFLFDRYFPHLNEFYNEESN